MGGRPSQAQDAADLTKAMLQQPGSSDRDAACPWLAGDCEQGGDLTTM